MLQKFALVVEWAVGLLGAGLGFGSILVIMFTDSPDFYTHLTPLQNLAFNYSGFFIYILPVIFVICFIFQSSIKTFPWSHTALAIGLVEILYVLVIFSAY
jgi:hypothetical protein